MQDSDAPIYAAIDIGSNTVHLVIARCFPPTLEILADEVELVRIGESVTATGSISTQKSDTAIATLLRYNNLAIQHGAQQIFVVATEAIRQASNNQTFLDAVLSATGLQVQLISGEVEATLTFHGATYEHTHTSQPPVRLSVMDLGGGSTELVLAKHMQIIWHTSLPIGSGWLHDRYFCADPPIQEDMTVAQTFLRTYLRGALTRYTSPMLIATGGTANTLLHLTHHAFGLTPTQHQLSRESLLRCESLLCSQPSAEIAERFGLELARVKILPAGALIIRSVMDRWHLDSITVSAHGIREGILLAFMHYGEQWLPIVTNISQTAANGNVCPPHDSDEHSADLSHDNADSFVSTGRKMLHERLEKMLDWRDEVLKRENVEAVHKMRVTSRRLRAVLDAYQPVCETKPFKKTQRQIKQLAALLGKVRDNDVMVMSLQNQLAHTPSEEQESVYWLIEHLSAYRQQHQQALASFLKKLDTHKLRQHIADCLPASLASLL